MINNQYHQKPNYNNSHIQNTTNNNQPAANQIQNMIFYSERCEKCQQLITLFRNENILRNFKMICVDNNLNNIPKQITHVPALIVNGVQKILMGKEAFLWFQNVKYLRDKNQINNQQQMGPSAFIASEMTGTNDNFSYTIDKFVDTPLPKTYVSYGTDDKNIIFTAPEQDKIKDKAQKMKLNDIRKMREQQDMENKEKMKELQMQFYLQNKKDNN